MKIVCLLGSPRLGGNSATIARRIHGEIRSGVRRRDPHI